MRQHRPLFHLFLPLQTHTLQILQQISLWKMSIQYMVPGFELWNMSLLPQPLDQSSRPTSILFHYGCCGHARIFLLCRVTSLPVESHTNGIYLLLMIQHRQHSKTFIHTFTALLVCARAMKIRWVYTSAFHLKFAFIRVFRVGPTKHFSKSN